LSPAPSSSSTLWTACLLPDEVRIGGVDDLEQEVGAHDLLERGPERVDEVVRQLVDEPDGVADHDLLPRRQRDLAARGIEGGEQHVRGVHVRIGDRVEERALPGVRVADQRDGRDLVPVALASGRGAVPASRRRARRGPS
jgi:hypothetical protein